MRSETRTAGMRKESDLNLRDMIKSSYETAGEKGFWGPPEMMDKWVAKLGLIHSEVTEILEALRKRQGADKVTEEFADVFIRAFDLHQRLVDAGEATDDLEQTIVRKLEANAARPAKHGHRWG